jgi:hypothetical protein
MFARPTESSTKRGYDARHRRARKVYADAIDRGDFVPCHFCGEAITISDGRHPWGLHLDHTPERDGYRGPAHNVHNVQDGARRGRAKQDPPRRLAL